MKRKTTAALLAALCFILLLPGCGLRAAKDRPAVTALSCTAPRALSALYPAGGSRLLVTWANYEQNRTTVQLVDADADTVRQETVLDGVWDLKEQSLSDGFALCDRENVVWQFLNSRLEQTGTWTAAENVDGWFSLDGGTYYFLRDGVLFRQQVDGGQQERLPLTPHGAGDVFTSALCGELLRGKGPREALERAAEFCRRCIQETAKRQPGHWYGLAFEPALKGIWYE